MLWRQVWRSGRVVECSHEERGSRHSVKAFQKIFPLCQSFLFLTGFDPGSSMKQA